MSGYVHIKVTDKFGLFWDYDCSQLYSCCGISEISDFSCDVVLNERTKWYSYPHASEKDSRSIMSLIRKDKKLYNMVLSSVVKSFKNDSVENRNLKFIVTDVVRKKINNKTLWENLSLYEIMTNHEGFVVGTPVINKRYADGHKVILAEYDISVREYNKIRNFQSKQMSNT